jgi:uncharacterized protein YkwD
MLRNTSVASVAAPFHTKLLRTKSLKTTSLRTKPLRTIRPLKILALGFAALLSTAVTLGAPSSASAAVTQTASCVDGGGVRWNAKAVWGTVYTAADGVRRATIDYAGWSTTKSGTVSTDSAVRTYDGSGRLIQELTWTGSFAYSSGATFKVRNPLDPPSSPGKAKITVSLGVNGDGFGNCTMTFSQPGATSTAPSVSDTYEADVITATNRERTSRGLAALSADACVDKYAEAQAKKMAAESRMYHQDLGPIMDECKLTTVGENVAYGYSDGKAVTAGWMGSTGHRENILNPRYRLIGVGAAQNSQGRWYAAQVFGART